MSGAANILLVDDRAENLLALEAILDPLGQRLLKARTGEEALKVLLEHDVALILLDVRMPGMDGFETASFIKRRTRTRHIPIIFLTAEASDAERVFEAYTVGAVDYMLKPFEPHVLRAKAQVFIELWEKGEQIREQQVQLRLAEQQAREREVEELQRASEVRYRNLAEAMPHVVWMSDAEGRLDYVNEQWYRYTGMTRLETDAGGWQVAVHPDERAEVDARWRECVARELPFELEYRFRAHDGSFRWQLGRAVPMYAPGDSVSGWIGTSTDIHDRKLLERTRDFLAQASAELGSTLEWERALERVAALAVQSVADWCAIDLFDDSRELQRVAVAYNETVNHTLAATLVRTDRAERVLLAASKVVAERAQPLVAGGADDDAAQADDALRDHLEVMRGLGLHAMVAAPLTIRSETIGVVSLLRGVHSGEFTDADQELALELARRLSTNVDRARLYRTAEQRARAATALATVADGVCMVDREGLVQLWNPAAERITGIDAERVVGWSIEQLLPGWSAVEQSPEEDGRRMGIGASTVPIDLGERELWLAVCGAPYDEGTVYTFRDITEQRIVDKMKTDFVATVSHELRTPLAAISGAAATLMRDDVELDEEIRPRLMQIMIDQSDRLSDMIQNLLLASRLDAGTVQPMRDRCDVSAVVRDVVASARAYAPESIEVRHAVADGLPPAEVDGEHLRQVVANLVENAIKYSPGGGVVEVSAHVSGDEQLSVVVRDHGIGIPRAEHDRIFEKFYRLDANMTRGIGGSGLGLYIVAELVRLMGGRIHVETPPDGHGTAFHLDVHVANGRADGNGHRPEAVAEAAAAGTGA